MMLFGLILFAGALAADDAGDAGLTVMSFNVRYGTALDGENTWPKRRDILIETIRRYDTDIIGTQECLEFQAEYIVQELPAYRWFGVGRAQGPALADEMTAVLYKKDVLSPLETGNFWLSETPDQIASKSWDSSLPRITTWALFHHRPTSRQFHFFNTHFDHRGATAREQSAALIAQRIRGLRESAPVIVAGDFNTAAESSAPWKTLIESGLRDAWQAAANPAGPTGTFHGFRGAASEGDARIDWILYRGSFEVLSCETVTHNAEGRYPSDHYPVIAVFKWSASQ